MDSSQQPQFQAYGQQQPMMQQQTPGIYPQYATAPRLIPFSKKWHWAKVVLRTLSVIFCLTSIGIDLGVTLSGYDSYGIFLALGIAPVIIALIWNLAEFITLCCRDRSLKRGIHPGAHVGMDLIIWLSLLNLLVWQAIIVSYNNFSDSYSYRSNRDDRYQDQKRNMIGGLAMEALIVIIHFILFIRDCVETHQRNSTRGPVIMIPPGSGPYILPANASIAQPYNPQIHGTNPQMQVFNPQPQQTQMQIPVVPPPQQAYLSQNQSPPSEPDRNRGSIYGSTIGTNTSPGPEMMAAGGRDVNSKGVGNGTAGA